MPPPPAAPATDPETEALKQHTARLQEQLSSMQFSGAPAEPATVSVKIPHAPPVAIQKELAKNAAKVLEMSQIHAPEPVPAAPVQPVKQDVRAKSSLEDEELKIPAWLEPLARNAAAPASTQELIEREKAKRLAEQSEVEETSAETVTAAEEEQIPELPLPTFGDALSIDEEETIPEAESGSSRKGILIGAIAAGVLLLAGGGWWYMQQQSGGVHAGSGPVANVQASVASLPVASSPPQSKGNSLPQTNLPAPSDPVVLTDTSAKSNPAPNTLSVVPASAPAATAHKSQPPLSPASGGAGSRTSAVAERAAEQPKKPVLGEVHLATPKIMPNRHAQNAAEPDAGVDLSNEEQPDSRAEALNAGLGGGNRQPSAPTAPPPVGGDVTQAKLISSVAPVYPALAKNQHVSGNVLIDALIDANGRVTTMKVVSGPTLLHQSAMDALKQWKYRPARLDGNPVPMHLTITIQFRLQ
jgi:TonB family protein